MTDRQLIEGILQGKRQAQWLLIKNYQRLVAHVVFKIVDDPMDREEVSQDVFVKVLKRAGDFGFQSKLGTWIATIAYREALNFLKKTRKARLNTDLQEEAYDLSEESLSYEQRDSNAFIRKAVNLLPVAHKTILVLYHLEGFSYSEIVEITGMPEGTVKSYLFRARKKLKTLLAPHLKSEVLL